MTVSAVSICSNALMRLGDKPISSLDENVDRARLTALYPVRRDAMLRSHPWNCAVKRVILAPLVDAPLYDYSYQFQLPADHLRTLQVGRYKEELDYKIESGKILCDETALPLRYIWRNEDPATWDSIFIEGMELAMVAAFAYAVTQSTTKEQACIQELQQYLKVARSIDGSEEPPETIGDYRLLTARYGSRYYAQS